MLGLATVLTDQGMEGIAAFVPPAPVRPKAAPLVVHAEEDAAAEASLGTWILLGVVAMAVVASGLGLWLASRPSDPPPRDARGAPLPIRDLTAEPPDAALPGAAPARGMANALPQPAGPAQAPAALSQGASAVAPPASAPQQRRTPPRARRSARESVFVANPEWTSQVRRIGEVDAETERSTMVILDSIHHVQERERQPRAPGKGAGRE